MFRRYGKRVDSRATRLIETLYHPQAFLKQFKALFMRTVDLSTLSYTIHVLINVCIIYNVYIYNVYVMYTMYKNLLYE